MGAFCDISVTTGTNELPLIRTGNKEWTNVISNEQLKLNISKPVEDRNTFYQHYTHEGNTIIVIGQFYEPVNLNQLLFDCLGHVYKDDHFKDPAGHYILFVHDRKNNIHVFTNRLGTYHAYWKKEANNNMIATSYMNLIKCTGNESLDWEAVSGFFAMGYFPEDRTYLQCIKVFEPASRYTFDYDLKLLHQKRYWHWSYHPSEHTQAENIQQVDKALSISLSHSLRNRKVALPLSGGLDSRTLAGVIAKPESKTYKILWAYSYGYSDSSIETRIAGRVAKAGQMNFDSYVVPAYLFDKMDTIIESIDLFAYVDGARQASMLEELNQHADVVVGGHWGDVWFDNIAVNTEMDITDYFKKKIVKRGSDWLLNEICALHIHEPQKKVAAYFNTYLDRYEHIKDKAYKLKAYKTDQWSFRWAAVGVRMYQAAVMPVLPFYDNRIVDVFATINNEQLNGRKLQIELLKKNYPELAAIKWQDYDSNLYLYKYFNNRNLIYRAFKKLKRTLSKQPAIIRNWELFYLNSEGRKQLQSILIDQGVLGDIVPKQKLQNLLDDFYKYPTAANGYTISMLHTFAQFMKRLNG